MNRGATADHELASPPVAPETVRPWHQMPVQEAGIVPVMITGDHPLTAEAIAQRLGIQDQGDSVLTGEELGQLSAEEMRTRVDKIRIGPAELAATLAIAAVVFVAVEVEKWIKRRW
jgi:high-affinity K+ transport system ATPase subunit B